MPVSYRNGLGIRSGKRRKLVHDLTGQRHGLLTVVRIEDRGNRCVTWLCECSCGGTKVVSTRNLRRGQVKSCGCLVRGHALRHGQSRPKSTLYRLWTKVRGRAKCCARWKRSSFEEFMGDIVAAIGNPSPRAWLCRVNPRRAWSRNNVAWMSPAEARARKCARKRGKKRRDYRHTPETRAKIGLANRGRRLSPEHLAKLIAANQGRTLSAEHRARIGASQRARYARSREENAS